MRVQYRGRRYRRWQFRRADNHTVRSCHMCGNPRRYGKGSCDEYTRQERIATLAEREQLAEAGLV